MGEETVLRPSWRTKRNQGGAERLAASWAKYGASKTNPPLNESDRGGHGLLGCQTDEPSGQRHCKAAFGASRISPRRNRLCVRGLARRRRTELKATSAEFEPWPTSHPLRITIELTGALRRDAWPELAMIVCGARVGQVACRSASG